MTEKELNQLHWLNKEIETLKKELERLENKSEVSAQVITGMPHGSGVGDTTANTAIDIVERKTLLILTISKAEIEKNRLERYISNIEDCEIRLIIRYRHLDQLSWEEIGQELKMERTTVSKKYHKFLKVSHISHAKAI